MYSLKDLQQEISQKIEWLKEHNGPVLHPDWITMAVLADHPDIRGEDADFYQCCSRFTVRKEVRERLNKTEAQPHERQLTFEGFNHLQDYYVITRDGDQVGVRIDLLTDDELDAKANEYEVMGRACFGHADELRRYRDIRGFKSGHQSPEGPRDGDHPVV